MTAANRLNIVVIALATLFAPGSLFGQTQEQVVYFHTDAIGSVRAITDANGQVIERHDYLPFGDLYPADPEPNEQRLFGGKERDHETKFEYFGARYYASGSGPVTTGDPVLDNASALIDPQRWNRYVYVRNSPLRYTDPDGRCIEDLCLVEGAIVIATVKASLDTLAVLESPQGQQQLRDIVTSVGGFVSTAAGAIGTWFRSESQGAAGLLPERAGPVGHISPSEVAGKTPAEIDARARDLGLVPKGPDPTQGRGSYVDPLTGEQSILSHPNDPRGTHGHVNDPTGRRIGPDGRVVPAASPDAHLPIRIPPKKKPGDSETELE